MVAREGRRLLLGEGRRAKELGFLCYILGSPSVRSNGWEGERQLIQRLGGGFAGYWASIGPAQKSCCAHAGLACRGGGPSPAQHIVSGRASAGPWAAQWAWPIWPSIESCSNCV